MSLSRKDLEDLRPLVDKTVQKFLGFAETTLVTAALNCVDKGYDKSKTVRKLCAILDEAQASKFADKLFSTYEDFKSTSGHGSRRHRKRKDESGGGEEASETKKPRKAEELPPPGVVIPPDPGNPSPGQLTADKIKEMMANAQLLIKERKAQLVASGLAPPEITMSPAEKMMEEMREKNKRADELKARIQARLGNSGINLGGAAALGAIGADADKGAPSMAGPTNMILDDQGRTIDAKTGEMIQLKYHMPTLKANIRAKRREEFKAVQEKPPEEISESKFFDPRVSGKAPARQKRGFKFHEQGKFESLAARLRTKAQLEKLQNEIAAAAKKTGIASAAKLATIQPQKELKEGEIPDMEWWDTYILRCHYDDFEKVNEDDRFDVKSITHLVEHPTQMRPPSESTKEIQIPVMLTKKETKKMRRQNRGEQQKELTEKIRLGLLPPPEPKVRLANLMRVLGNEAIQDPTKVEQHVREQMAKRVKAHEDANAARKLTKEQRSAKKIQKLKEDTTLGVQVLIYRVNSLQNPSKKFKVETNANQLFMTGIVVLHRECNVVVVEGGPKQQKKFRRLMLHRIKWDEDKKAKDDDADSDDEESKKTNSCVLVWEGQVKTRAFGEMKFKMCPTESFAREQFKKCGVEHYWDLAYSGAVIEAAGEEL